MLQWFCASILVVSRTVCFVKLLWLIFLRRFHILVASSCACDYHVVVDTWADALCCFDLRSLYWSVVGASVWIRTCERKTLNYLWTEPKSLMIRPWFCFVPNGCEKSRRIHARDAHLVLHGSFSWLFIRRRGRSCRRWMFLRTTRGTRSTCRFCAVVSWMEILIDFGSTIFSRTCGKVQDEGGLISHPPFGHFNYYLMCIIVLSLNSAFLIYIFNHFFGN